MLYCILIKYDKKKKIKYFNFKKVILLISLICFFLFFIFITNNNKFQISDINISGNYSILDDGIIDSVHNLTNKNIFFISMGSIFTININKIEKQLKKDFPEISSVKISIDKLSLNIKITERLPHSIWCKLNDNINYLNNSEVKEFINFDDICFFVDKYGYVYTRSPYFSDGVFDKIYTSKNVLNIGNYVMNKNDFNIFFNFLNELTNKLDFTVANIYMDDNNTIIFLRSILNKTFKNEDYPYIIFYSDEDLNIILRNIRLMLNNELFRDDFSKYPHKLRYIDLRIIDQIRYKFNN